MKTILKNLLLGILAGIAIALGGILNVLCNAYIGDPWGKLIGSLLFPIGLSLVCYLSFGLFTGKIGFVFDNKPKYLLYLLTIYIGNFIGSLIMGSIIWLIFVKNGNNDFATKLMAVADGKMNAVSTFPGALTVFGGSLLCGMLVYTAVFSYKHFKRHIFKLLGIFLSIALFVYMGFDHCVANMFYFMGGHFGENFSQGYSYLNIALATVGNSLGAIGLNTLFNLTKKTA